MGPTTVPVVGWLPLPSVAAGAGRPWGRIGGTPMLRLRQVVLDAHREGPCHRGHGGDLVYRRAADAFDRAESAQQEPLASGADAGDFFDAAAVRAGVAELPVIA